MDNINGTPTLPNDVINDALKDIIKRIVKTENYTLHIEWGSSKGDNFIGIVYRVKVKLNNAPLKNCNSNNDNNKQNDDEINIIVKLPPQNATRRKQFFARPTFLREALVYDEILPLYMEFQESKGIVVDKDGFHEVPKCLGTITEDGYEAIFLEDLKQKGFQMFNRLEKITLEHVEVVIKIFAKFHAVSFAVKDQWPERMSKFKSIPEIFAERKDDEQLLTYFDSLKVRALESLCPKTDKIIIDKINKYFEKGKFMDVILRLTSGKEAEPYAILCHGDSWNNNILFRYEADHPSEARLIDWQISRYASPVTDLMYYIFTATTKGLRDKHYDDLINIYHEQLSTFLRKLGSDPEKVFPRKALDDQLKKFGLWGFLMAMMLLPIITTYAEDMPDLEELSEQMESGNLDTETTFKPEKTLKVYQERMRDVALDMERLGYFQ